MESSKGFFRGSGEDGGNQEILHLPGTCWVGSLDYIYN